jgi:major type 1 subunit fimbrin (pilin)
MTMKKTTLSLALSAVAGLGLWAPAAQAFDGTITFNGTVSSQTCEINGGSKDFAVELPTVAASTLESGTVAGLKNFHITLTGCASEGRVRTYFPPSTYVDATTYQLRNALAVGSGGAVGVQVQILDAETLQPIKVGADQGEQDSPWFDIDASGTVDMKYLAGYIKAGTDPVQPGEVKAYANYTVEYE